ncbi:hypothetical protein GUJ93_ZPchr0002g22955 [Zizania palustris]|uniref:CENP-V/GFA domain-containing protein n=1 Tax=Zizania palustris TaxID=103762 RepID=A0A8J5RZ30_ZIZPA|nr:hypothetical protein GUJ93_ZPchr0002g22955 [Zizania palustris]
MSKHWVLLKLEKGKRRASHGAKGGRGEGGRGSRVRESHGGHLESYGGHLESHSQYNPIMEWLSNSRSEFRPILDEYDDDDDWNTHGGFLIDELQMEAEEVTAFKRKHKFGTKDTNKKRKMRLEKDDLLEEDDYIDGETEEISSTSKNGAWSRRPSSIAAGAPAGACGGGRRRRPSSFITTYTTFGTHTAKHTFCKVCGITSFYRPRSNPDGISITVAYVDPGTLAHVEYRSARRREELGRVVRAEELAGPVVMAAGS